jgi:hypothetical protein
VPIPGLLPIGLLPPGTHAANLDDIRGAFGGGNDRRVDLFAKFEAFLAIARGFRPTAVFIDGSFVTDKPAPGDIDAVLEFAPTAFAAFVTHPGRDALLLTAKSQESSRKGTRMEIDELPRSS